MSGKQTPNFLKAIKAVLWSFLGVRKSSAHRADLAELKPLHVIAAAVLCAGVFIGLLVVVVHTVIGIGK
jgi:hypothetical protein